MQPAMQPAHQPPTEPDERGEVEPGVRTPSDRGTSASETASSKCSISQASSVDVDDQEAAEAYAAHAVAQEAAEANMTLSKASEHKPNVQGFFISVALYSMLMLVMIPLWNGVVLLRSVPYSHLMGIGIPLVFIVCIGIVVLCFFAVVSLFFKYSRPEAQTGQTLVMIGSAILTMLGVAFMLFGHGLSQTALATTNEILHNCRFGPQTSTLYSEYHNLYALRQQPSCASLPSVEMCHGFNQTYEAVVLKAIEREFRCTSFCDSGNKGVATSVVMTLFSQADYQSSCHMMLVRNLRNYVADLGDQMYCQGCMLVLTCVVVGFLKLIGFCAPKPRLPTEILYIGGGAQKKQPVRPPPSYGATAGTLDA